MAITVIHPDLGATIGMLTPRSQFPEPMTIAEALQAELAIPDYAYDAVLVQTDSIGQWAVLIEPNGWIASMPEVLAKLAAKGIAVSVFWNVNADMQFAFARDGELVRQFDPLLYDESDRALAEEAQLGWGVEHPRASALALLERLTSVRIEHQWLVNRSRQSYIVPVTS